MQELGEGVEGVRALHLLQNRAARAADSHLLAAQTQGQGRVHADEGIAAQLLPFLHRFQQKGGFAGLAQLEIDGDRGFQVGGQNAIDGNDVALTGELADGFKGW